MKRFFTTIAILGAACAGLHYLSAAANQSKPKGAPMLAHNVYFSLEDNGRAARQRLVEASHEYLSPIPGIEFYAAGTLADADRDVNDRDFDVALHVVFKDQAAMADYLEHPQHVKFVEKNKANWKKVRVFDSEVSGAK